MFKEPNEDAMSVQRFITVSKQKEFVFTFLKNKALT